MFSIIGDTVFGFFPRKRDNDESVMQLQRNTIIYEIDEPLRPINRMRK
jgi:hypothetical protein